MSRAAGKWQRRLLGGVGLGVVLYAGMLLWADAGKVWEALRSLAWWVVPAALALAFTNYVLRFVRWQRYLRLLDIRIAPWTSFLISLAGLSMSVTPGKMGEVFKSWLVRQVHGARIHQTAPIVVAERVTDLLGYLVLIACSSAGALDEYAWVAWTGLVTCAVLVLGLSSRRVSKATRRTLKRTPYFWRLAERVEGAFDSARVLLQPRELLLPVALSVVGWGLECTAFHLIANALVPGGITWQAAVFAFAFSAVAGALMIFAPGGLGVTEFSLGKLLRGHYSASGLSLEAAQQTAAAAVIVARASTLWFAVLLGLLALFAFTRRYGRIEEGPETEVQAAP